MNINDCSHNDVTLQRYVAELLRSTNILTELSDSLYGKNKEVLLHSLSPFFYDSRLSKAEEPLSDKDFPIQDQGVQLKYSNIQRGPVPVFSGGVIPYLKRGGFKEALSFDIKNAKSAADVPCNQPRFFLNRLMRDVCGTVFNFFRMNDVAPFYIVILAGDEFSVYHRHPYFQESNDLIVAINKVLPDALYYKNGGVILKKAQIKLNCPAVTPEVTVREEVEKELDIAAYSHLQKRIDNITRIQPELSQPISFLKPFPEEIKRKLLDIMMQVTYDPFRTILSSRLTGKNAGLYKDISQFIRRIETSGLEDFYLVSYIVPNLAKRVVDDETYGFLAAHKIVRALFTAFLATFDREEIEKVFVLREGANFYFAVSRSKGSNFADEAVFKLPSTVHCSSLTTENQCKLPVIYGKAMEPVSLTANRLAVKEITVKNEQEFKNKMVLINEHMLKDYFSNLENYLKKPQEQADYIVDFLAYTCDPQSTRWQNTLAQLGLSLDDVSHLM